MVTRRRALTLASAAILILSAALFAQTTPQQRKLTDAEKKEIQTVQKVVDDAAAGQAAANDVGFAWMHEDLLKAQGNKQYLPFSVIDRPDEGHRQQGHLLLARRRERRRRARGRSQGREEGREERRTS